MEKGETKLLFNIRRDMEDSFTGQGINKQLLGEIGKKMLLEKNIDVTAKKCKNKFKALKGEWWATCDHNNLSGNDRKDCAFFNEFNHMYAMIESTHLCLPNSKL